jgi:hypothetical protein
MYCDREIDRDAVDLTVYGGGDLDLNFHVGCWKVIETTIKKHLSTQANKET